MRSVTRTRVEAIDTFIDELELAALGFSRTTPAATGRLACDPSTLLEIYSIVASTACSRAGGGNATRVVTNKPPSSRTR